MIIAESGQLYQSIKLLGSGSFGSVYLVKELNSKQEYACKIISKAHIQKYDASSMIQNEINIHVSCNHKNIVRLYSYWEDCNNIYILLEYCSKGHLIDPKTPFNDDDVFQVFHQILDGVNYLHQNNIIHRDLKFENILIHEDGTLKLCDFGWAIKVDQMSVPNVMCGTTEYMPPEVVSKSSLDFKLDAWSLGVILYVLLYGKFPFQGDNQDQLIRNILYDQLIIPSRNDINEDLTNLIQALLIKNSQLRPSIEQIYLCKWMKLNMKSHNIFNHYENEQLKLKVKQKNITLKVVNNSLYSTPNKKMVNSNYVESKNDFDHKSTSFGKTHNSCRTIKSISINPSPQIRQIDKFFNFLENIQKF
ncbi:unnamed protein product [Paramecium primaurelia]|uniref:Protein kinase domain-containing protein n=1 Tax=Paramecium primaurelia TaxID=5886 RepID=A0A8S1PCK0_PARPR|nr:unnamed protein product [Paramecium primaurelia]